MIRSQQAISLAAIGFVISLCSACAANNETDQVQTAREYFGTLTPFASESVYFILTDRFVDGDPRNNNEDQGGDFPSFNIPLKGPDGLSANIGYLGGDFKGVLNNADYIRDMGFTSVWLTPIVDNPDAAFSGGEKVTFGSHSRDGGKTGYHGYWGVNFYKVDEHLESNDLSFAQFTKKLKDEYQLKFILDVVANHGSPAYSMPVDQAGYGEIYDENNHLVADHQNLKPQDLDKNKPLHQFYNRKPGLAQLSDINENNAQVLDYFVGSYLKWIDQGAAALRIDTIKEMPHYFWKKVADRVRELHPGLFMFGESYSWDAELIAQHTKRENGGISVLDFPGVEAIKKVFEHPQSDFSDVLSSLHLDDQVYRNPYDLMTFYDNHDMARINTTDKGVIDANNWLFTARGIPVIYYGSEINFMAGAQEHAGNRNYFGQERIELARRHPIRQHLKTIANVRKHSLALQKGLQVNLEFKGDKASFYRVFQHKGKAQTALVLLNKGEKNARFTTSKYLSKGKWRNAFTGEVIEIDKSLTSLDVDVKAHGISLYFLDSVNLNNELIAKLDVLQSLYAP